MADFATLEILGKCSAYSTMTPAQTVFDPASYALLSTASTAGEYIHTQVQADTGGTSVALTHIGTMTLLVVKNLDVTNYVTATFGSVANGSNNILRIAAGGFLVTTDIDSNLTLAANSAACNCEVFVVGT